MWDKSDWWAIVILVVYCLLVIAVAAGLSYVAVHFIMKFW